ncbi:tyrosine-type recombinase/integrase [Gellertiella hungarica]|uniref:Integrase n=1 Tax=Gellertiella hungarica TaxID=1572859 RepID=A0A7W6NKT9_9HYPH|nr:tyrosine-type recombinase/integrase [Gellertiella hungarica]MBB4064750.1 integrase [Gellertiella hungarica]
MKGHIRERSPGKWAIVLDVGEPDPITGKKKRKWHSFAGTKRQAQAECARLITEISSGAYVEPTKQTVGEFLREWMAFVRPTVTPKTHQRYAEICEKNLGPLIGDVALAKLKTDKIDAAFAKALTEGRRRAGGGLAPRTVHHMRRVLIKALGQAVTWDRLSKNPAAATTPPKVERTKMLAYDVAQTAELLEAFRPTRMFMPVMLAVMCGMRRGEILALRWKDVDFANGSISVRESAEQVGTEVRYKETKSGKTRNVAMSVTVLEELKRHRLAQAEEQLRIGLRPDEESFVVAQADGRPLKPVSLTHEWTRLLARTGLPRIRFHDLRHTHASQMLSAGVHPKVASERLGHSTIGITLDLYSHVMPGMQADAAAQVDAALQAAISASRKSK